MKHIKIILPFFLWGGFLFLIVVFVAGLIIHNQIVTFPFGEIQFARIRYYDTKNDKYIEKEIYDKNELESIYNCLKKAKVKKFYYGGCDENGSDYGWSLTIKYYSGLESYDYDKEIKTIPYACRKYQKKTPTSKADSMLIISSEDLVNKVNSYIE